MARKKELKKAETFKVGDFVGAKVKGHSLWPGRVEKVDTLKNGPRYTVRFFGTNETGQSFKEIKLFKNFTDKDKTNNKAGFQDALAICQKLYNQRATEQPPGSSSSSSCSAPSSPTVQAVTSTTISPSTTAPNTDTTFSVKIKQETIEKEQTRHSNAAREKEAEAKTERKRSRAAANIGDEIPKARDAKPTKYLKVSAKPELRAPKISASAESTTRAESGSVQTEGENVKATPDRARTLAKLRSKIDNKVAEKQVLKQKMLAEKRTKKALGNFVYANNFLSRFLPAARAIQKAQAGDQIQQANQVARFIEEVQKLQKVLPALSKSIAMTNDLGCSLDYGERHKFYEIFTDTCVELKAIEKTKKVPTELKDKVYSCRKQMKSDGEIKKFLSARSEITDQSRNKTILETRDNDANSGRIVSRRKK